jgi:hypothetical protein
MLKAKIEKEVMITNKEIAQFLFKDGTTLEKIDELLEDMLYDEYKMDYDSRCDAVSKLTNADYAQILESLANKIRIADEEEP